MPSIQTQNFDQPFADLPPYQKPAAGRRCPQNKYGYNISLPCEMMPYQMVQMSSDGAFFYLDASYNFGI
ncbi:hypothetical protein [Hymenobacter rubidus]|uniref:hypothetical protein n=1 Tax=Hymenobacter rubidus TaxID=1441626 RepID=UPI00191E3F61|nr:hypothetical protein [Hymenobacter rubidus]